MSPDEVTEERIARNEAIFRDANEKIRKVADAYELDGPIPFICECAEPRCTAILQIDLAAYRRVRANPRWFVNDAEHPSVEEAAKLVERHPGYIVVEKTGHAGDVAEALDSTRTETA